MPRKTKDAPGRVTPKGGPARRAGSSSSSAAAVSQSGRYTAPIPREFRSSPWWVPALIVTFMGLGLICIVCNYLSAWPGSPSNVYLFVGLGLIVAGFISATRWH